VLHEATNVDIVCIRRETQATAKARTMARKTRQAETTRDYPAIQADIAALTAAGVARTDARICKLMEEICSMMRRNHNSK